MKHRTLVAIYAAQGHACALCDRHIPEPKAGAVTYAIGGVALLAHAKCARLADTWPIGERMLRRLEAVLRAMSPALLSIVTDAAVQAVHAGRERAAQAQRETDEAAKVLGVVIRQLPTEAARRVLARL